MRFLGIEHTNRLFELFHSTMEHSIGKCLRSGPLAKSHQFGDFLFLMRNIMMRHSMEQMCRKTKVDLMSLPPKVSVLVFVLFIKSGGNLN